MLRTGPTRFFILVVFLLAGCDLVPGPSLQTATPSQSPLALATHTPTTIPALPVCAAADLQGVAGWPGATGALAGGIFLENKGDTECTLQGWPGVHIIGPDGGMFPITDVHSEDSATSCCPTVDLKPGGRTYAGFQWRNLCQQAKGPFSLAVALPGEGGQVNVPVLDPSGTPLSDTPRCDNANEASTIVVEPFVAPPAP